MRTTDMITQDEFACYFYINFSPLIGNEQGQQTRFQILILGLKRLMINIPVTFMPPVPPVMSSSLL